MHLPQLIPAIQHYHWVLKTCHAGAELDTALTCAQGFVDPDLRCVQPFKLCRRWFLQLTLEQRSGKPC